MLRLVLHLLFLSLILVPMFEPPRAWGQTGPQIIIRDAEIEQTLKEWTTPIIRAAGLDSDAVHLILVQSPETNAFVAGGQNIFIYTGLLNKTDNPGEVIGVVAHELGHIAGGHLIRGRAMVENAAYETMLGTLLGLGVAVATGSGEAGMAVTGGAQAFTQRKFLAFSRTQESAADQAGLRFLRMARINPTGLVTFMQKLEDQELLPAAQQNEYVRTHPISRDRVEVLTASLADSGTSKDSFWPDRWQESHARMKAKLLGFISPEQVTWVYPETDQTIPAAYARVIADYRQNRVESALAGVDRLIGREPRNPYFYELKGQMLFDFGRAAQAAPLYAQAVELAPDQPLIRLAYAQALADTPGVGTSVLLRAAQLLEQVRGDEPRNLRVYRLLATIYGKLKQDGTAQAMLAEESFLRGQYDESRRLAQGALQHLPKESRDIRRVQDLLAQLDQIDRKKKEKE